ncbi:MAG: hypothetical protein ACTSQ5_09700 [Promethearchaeota archaeon]
MASVKSDISLQIKNNLNRTATFSILGGTQDPSNGQANAKTIYEWDLTAETFANTTVVTIEASTVTNPVIINYEVQNQDGAITDLETVVRLLNTLNLGVFNLDGNTIWIIDDINIFGNIEVLVSLSFDINVFVQEAYNYFDPLGKTPLVDFQTRYTSVIQQAVDTIPDFVDFVESQGWSLCYPTNATEISIIRVSAGSFFYITDIGGVLTTNEATSGTSITQAGLENTLLYTADISIWTTLQEIEFLAPPLIADDGYIFKFIFETTISTDFKDDGLNNNAWSPLDSTYFVNAENQNILVQLKPNTALDFYGSDFPNIFQPLGYEITFRSINGRVELIPDGFGIEKLVFNEMDNVTILRVQDIWGATTGTVDCDFSTLIDNTQGSLDIILSFYDDAALPVPQEIELDTGFNTKFAQLPDGYGQLSLGGNNFGTNYPLIRYLNTITALELAFQRIYFDMSVTENLPDIEQIGLLFALTTEYLLRLDLRNQNIAYLGVGRDMGYFNDWFFKLGKQTFLSQYPASTSGGFGDILASTGNNFVLSGQGYYGYQALIENGFTITTPVGAITSNILTFTVKEGEQVLIQTISGLGQSTFQTTGAIGTSAEVVSNSSITVVGTEELNLVSVGGNNNQLFTIDPTLDCLQTYIGSAPAFPTNNTLTTFICGGGIFNVGVNQGIFTIQGLTITLPIYPSTTIGDAYGLYQRDFSGLNGNNTSELSIKYYRINTTQFANPLVTPYGSNALFNISVNGIIPSIPQVTFTDCEFATDINDNSANAFPLELLFPVGARINVATTFKDCLFNYTASTFGGIIGFNINNGGSLTPSQTALCGLCTIDNTTFGAFGNDTIRLQTNYNGVGDTLSNLILRNNNNLVKVFLNNLATAVPPAILITLDTNPLLNSFIFQNYNLTILTITGGLPLVTEMRVEDNNMSSATLDNIIIALDNNGLNNGTLNYSNQTTGASPNIGVSGLAYNNLIAKGWTVTGNVPI